MNSKTSITSVTSRKFDLFPANLSNFEYQTNAISSSSILNSKFDKVAKEKSYINI